MANPIVTIEMEDGGLIRAELFADIAPKTVKNFVDLAGKGFYDGLTFHRVIKGFMIQGGCPLGNGTGGPGYTIQGEFAQNGFKNDLKHTRGVLSMARSSHPDSAGSQFFIMTDDAPHLDGAYAAFGKVLDDESLAVVDAIVSARTPRSEINAGKSPYAIFDDAGSPVEVHQGNVDMPLAAQRIKRMTTTNT
ncbi:MAG: peptidylprolyl isomerase [Christensenellales bacterium]